MTDSDQKEELIGQDLLDAVVHLTRLPDLEIRAELQQLFVEQGHDSAKITLDQLRETMLMYLEEIAVNFPEVSKDVLSSGDPDGAIQDEG